MITMRVEYEFTYVDGKVNAWEMVREFDDIQEAVDECCERATEFKYYQGAYSGIRHNDDSVEARIFYPEEKDEEEFRRLFSQYRYSK